MSTIRSVCIYCGSSSQGPKTHRAAARRFGGLLAENGVTLIFGGGHIGLMGDAADGALAAGGKVIGVIPSFLRDLELAHTGCSEMIVTDSMHSRKEKMAELADGFAILPGGLGTLDEAFEIITWRQLGLHDKPIVLLDQDGYWAPLKAMLQAAVDGKYMHPDQSELVRSVAEADEVLPALRAMPASTQPVETKWL
ncbi:MAG: TIGR00730 family Rossman fold protein [Alphaproteobacteria bacterium]|nr:TIGR00730 family Rossman fold protein [Alphaproteobacteria bacterium]